MATVRRVKLAVYIVCTAVVVPLGAYSILESYRAEEHLSPESAVLFWGRVLTLLGIVGLGAYGIYANWPDRKA